MRTLSRKKSHRESMIRNLVSSLLLYESIKTTTAKAKEVKRVTDKLISSVNKDELNSIKMLNSFLFDRNATRKVIGEIMPRYSDKKSGFVRILKISNRIGDNSPMSIVEFVDKKTYIKKTEEAKSVKDKVSKLEKVTTKRAK